MPEPTARPDPDALLLRVQQTEARLKRGKLKIFFGFAPGVGKTYRMLQVARDLVCDHKLDVVVGIVEDHRRADTAAMVLGLQLLPKKSVEYRGHALLEFDLDAALARKPDVLLLDELAHTNAPGSRHAKRWQDVEELLSAGIDVLSTMNVQHVESLNDIILQITGVQVRETVPDAVLDRADAIELIDIAPEELLLRLKEGKVYLNDQAQRAMEHFFQRGNLLALRELALRRTAQHVDEDVLEYRKEHGVVDTWPAGERILVCVGPAPSSDRLIRTAARMAAGLRCPWVASYVDATTVGGFSDSARERLEAHLRLAESLGGAVKRLPGERIAEALLLYARKHNVTRMVIGKPTHPRWRDRVTGSLLDDVVRGSGDIDVHVISGGSKGDAPLGKDHSPDADAPRALRARVSHYAQALLIVGVALPVAAGLRGALHLPDLEMLFVLAVMVTAVLFGRGPSLLAASLGVACYDFFFVPPLFTFSVNDRRYFLTFAMMFGVGLVMSELVARLRRQEREAVAREERTAAFYALTKELASTDQLSEIASIAGRHATDLFGARAAVLGASPDGDLRELGAHPADLTVELKDMAVARWAHEHNALSGAGTDTVPGSQILCAPLRVGASRLGVLALIAQARPKLRIDQRVFLEMYCRQVATALERVRLSEEAKASALRARTEEMRSSLLSAVSHDLRTPLASITGAATALRDEVRLDQPTQKELLESIVDEAERLERLVANLLDMTRLESGSVALKKDWVPLDEMIGSALTRLERELGARPITVSIAPDVPLVLVDPVLFEQVFVNVLENANKYTPQEQLIEVHATHDGQTVIIEVGDHGLGFAPGTETQVFEKFFRGSHLGVPGAGLGLPICKGIVEAHGGHIRVKNRAGGGAIVRIVLPSGGTPPTLMFGDNA